MLKKDLTLKFFINDVDGVLRLDMESAPWTVIPEIKSIVAKLVMESNSSPSNSDIFIDPSSTIEAGAVINGPTYISAGCFVAAGAYLRGGVFLGKNVSVGPGCEIKSSIIFPGTCLAHFNFIGDSIIGRDVNFEAGSHTANHWNERKDKRIGVMTLEGMVSTQCEKFGAMVGDGVRVGANSVLSPGTLLVQESVVPRLTLIDQTSNLLEPFK